MADPATHVAILLEQAGVGSRNATSGWLIRTGQFSTQYAHLPQLLVVNTPGSPPELGFGDASADLRLPGVQVLVRGNADDYAGAYAKAEEVRSALHKRLDALIDGTLYRRIVMVGEPIWLGYEPEQNRPMWSLNFELMKEG